MFSVVVATVVFVSVVVVVHVVVFLVVVDAVVSTVVDVDVTVVVSDIRSIGVASLWFSVDTNNAMPSAMHTVAKTPVITINIFIPFVII